MENGHIVNVTKNVLLEECDQETVGSRLGKENSEKNVCSYLTLQV